MFWLQLAITAITLLALPLWKRAGPLGSLPGRGSVPQHRSYAGGAYSRRAGRLARVHRFLRAGIHLRRLGKHLFDRRQRHAGGCAARAITFYYIGMAAGRFLSGVLSGKLSARQLLHLGQGITLAAVFLLAFAQPAPLRVLLCL